MFDDFKLYDELYSRFKSETKFDAIDQLVLIMRKLDPLGLQVVGALIQKHSKNPDVIPYDGADAGENKAKFDLRKFDPVLQHILLEFGKMHCLQILANREAAKQNQTQN